MFIINLEFLNLSEKMEKYLEREFSNLEKTTNKSREYHFNEALINYMEDQEEVKETENIIKKKHYPNNYHIIRALTNYIQDVEDMREVEKRLKNKTKYYTSEELNKRLEL